MKFNLFESADIKRIFKKPKRYTNFNVFENIEYMVKLLDELFEFGSII